MKIYTLSAPNGPTEQYRVPSERGHPFHLFTAAILYAAEHGVDASTVKAEFVDTDD